MRRRNPYRRRFKRKPRYVKRRSFRRFTRRVQVASTVLAEKKFQEIGIAQDVGIAPTPTIFRVPMVAQGTGGDSRVDLTLQVLSALETKLGSLRSSIISSRRSTMNSPPMATTTTILSSSDSSSEEQWTTTPTSSATNLPQPETPSSSSTSRPSPSTRTAAKSELSKTRR